MQSEVEAVVQSYEETSQQHCPGSFPIPCLVSGLNVDQRGEITFLIIFSPYFIFRDCPLCFCAFLPFPRRLQPDWEQTGPHKQHRWGESTVLPHRQSVTFNMMKGNYQHSCSYKCERLNAMWWVKCIKYLQAFFFKRSDHKREESIDTHLCCASCALERVKEWWSALMYNNTNTYINTEREIKLNPFTHSVFSHKPACLTNINQWPGGIVMKDWFSSDCDYKTGPEYNMFPVCHMVFIHYSLI